MDICYSCYKDKINRKKQKEQEQQMLQEKEKMLQEKMLQEQMLQKQEQEQEQEQDKSDEVEEVENPCVKCGRDMQLNSYVTKKPEKYQDYCNICYVKKTMKKAAKKTAPEVVEEYDQCSKCENDIIDKSHQESGKYLDRCIDWYNKKKNRKSKKVSGLP